MATQVVFQQPSKGEAQEVPSTSRSLSARFFGNPAWTWIRQSMAAPLVPSRR